MRLKGVRAVVSGGVSGLGLAVTRRVLNAGGQVAILDVNEAAWNDVADEFDEKAHFLPTDVTDPDAVEGSIQSAAEALGYISLAVNCAGVMHGSRVIGRNRLHGTEEFRRVVEINLVGTFNVCRSAAWSMQLNAADDNGERGVIVNTTSIAAWEGQIGQVAYAASKGGVASLTLPMAREFARFGIRVMAIAPGVFHTPAMDSLSEPAREHLVQSVPFPSRMGEPDEFASLVLAIYENPMLNGEVIRLDGGLRMPAM